jgi:hypothetical protein
MTLYASWIADVAWPSAKSLKAYRATSGAASATGRPILLLHSVAIPRHLAPDTEGTIVGSGQIMARQGTFQFDQRFMPRYAGALIHDPAVALVELVANSWDAYATRVDVTWPDRQAGIPFAISDNGKGMTAGHFERRWTTFDYNRKEEEGTISYPPADLPHLPPRHVYGRNGKGRHAAFCFANKYTVRTWRDGAEVTYDVTLGTEDKPFDWRQAGKRNVGDGHGTEIKSATSDGVNLAEERAREVLGMRFLTDPNFAVYINGQAVSFDDIPHDLLRESEVPIDGLGTAKIRMIDVMKPDRTTRQHGIAWRVNNRLVGQIGWRKGDYERVLDGRTADAKRYTFIVAADFLADADAVNDDWSDFRRENAAWQKAEPVVQDHIKQQIAAQARERRVEDKAKVRERNADTVHDLPPISRELWDEFVDEVIDTCPTITVDQVVQVAGILASLEKASTQYGLLSKLHDMGPGDLDALHNLLDDWTVKTAKIALDIIQTRLKLIRELDTKLRDRNAEEVQDLQPLIESSLWIFGPEFESVEYTSNRGMTTVIRKLFGKEKTASRNRPDFVIIPEEGSIGFYSRDSHGPDHEVNGVASLVVAEIKRPGIPISGPQKEQAWKYVKELLEHGLITRATSVHCFVLGEAIDPAETDAVERQERRVVITPISYDAFIRRAERRMMNLRNKLRDAPFLKEKGLDVPAYIEHAAPEQPSLLTVRSPDS